MLYVGRIGIKSVEGNGGFGGITVGSGFLFGWFGCFPEFDCFGMLQNDQYFGDMN